MAVILLRAFNLFFLLEAFAFFCILSPGTRTGEIQSLMFPCKTGHPGVGESAHVFLAGDRGSAFCPGLKPVITFQLVDLHPLKILYAWEAKHGIVTARSAS